MVKATVLKKLAVDGADAFVKSFCSEGGKQLHHKDKNTSTNLNSKMSAVKDSVNLISNKYDWDSIDNNLYHASDYVKELLPIVGITGASFVLLPVVVGAGVGATIGIGAVATTYTLTNGAVLAIGGFEFVKKINTMSKPNDSECNAGLNVTQFGVYDDEKKKEFEETSYE